MGSTLGSDPAGSAHDSSMPRPIYEPDPLFDITSHPVFKPGPFDGSVDQYIYHYTRWETLLDIAQDGLRLNSLARMNDPRESKEWFLGITSGTDDDTSGVWRIAHRYRELVRAATFYSDVHIDQDEQKPVRRGYARPRMWAQYARNHTGVCIVFDRANLSERVTAAFVGRPGGWLVNGRVAYVTDQKDDPAYQGIQVVGIPAEEAVSRFYDKYRERIFLVKHADWRDEAEFRFLAYDPVAPLDDDDPADAHGTFVSLNGCVAGLVLGTDFKTAHIPAAREFMRAVNAEPAVVQCMWDRLSARLIPLGDDDGSWVVCRDHHAVAAHLTFGPATPKCPSSP
jgi:hypothetical protein